jgi:mannosyltransferase OCH1-like enzyme
MLMPENKYNYEKISCRPSTKELFKRCKEEFLKHHPEFEHVFLTEDKIMYEICTYYLG